MNGLIRVMSANIISRLRPKFISSLFILTLAMTPAWVAQKAFSAETDRPPNIVFILADDK